MSDVTNEVNVEQQNQEKLAKCYLALLWNVGGFCGGILVSSLGIAIMAISTALGGILFALGGIMFFIASLTVVVKYFQNRTIAALFKMREYEVITTYEDGRKESDGGMESAMGNLFLWLLKVVIIISLAPLLEAIYIVIMTIKYAALYGKVADKPPFIRSGIFVSLMGVAAIIASMIIQGLAL